MKSRLVLMLSAILCAVPTCLSLASEPTVIAEGSSKQAPKQPQAAVADDGSVHLVYGVGDAVYYCSLSNGGDVFSTPKQAFRASNMSLGMRRGPRIAATDKSLIVTVVGGQQGKGRDGDVLAWRSSDHGTSWQGPVRVNDTADSAREGLHAMAAGSDGLVWCVWLDLRAKRTELFASQSTDGGATWSKNVLVYRSPAGSICECCHPSIAVRGDTIHVLFRNSLSGNRDMYLATSHDGGAHFEDAKCLGNEHWQLNACPMDGGMLAIEPDGTVSTAWRRGGLVYATSKGDPSEALLVKGEQPWLASTAKGALAVWTKSREGELFVSSLSEPQPRSLASNARDPMIASSASHVGPVIVCWESKDGDVTRIMASRVDELR